MLRATLMIVLSVAFMGAAFTANVGCVLVETSKVRVGVIGSPKSTSHEKPEKTPVGATDGSASNGRSVRPTPASSEPPPQVP
jgi:hypothetical protein